MSQTAILPDAGTETSIHSLSGWGRTAAVRSTVARPRETAALEEMLATASGQASAANGSELLSGMTGTPGRYFQSWWARDFITMSAAGSR